MEQRSYTKRQLQLGQIASIVIKSETTVLLLLREKTASWVPELGVYEIEKKSSDKLICKNLDNPNDYAPLSFNTEVQGYSSHLSICHYGACERISAESYAIAQ